MLPSVPIATDNIYKFAAPFGLVLIITTGFGVFYLGITTYEFGFKNFEQYESLIAKEHLSQEESIRKKALDHEIKLKTETVKYTMYFLTFLTVVGIIISFWGGLHWFKQVQPKQDELLNLQIEKTKREIAVLDKQLEKSE